MCGGKSGNWRRPYDKVSPTPVFLVVLKNRQAHSVVLLDRVPTILDAFCNVGG